MRACESPRRAQKPRILRRRGREEESNAFTRCRGAGWVTAVIRHARAKKTKSPSGSPPDGDKNNLRYRPRYAARARFAGKRWGRGPAGRRALPTAGNPKRPSAFLRLLPPHNLPPPEGGEETEEHLGSSAARSRYTVSLDLSRRRALGPCSRPGSFRSRSVEPCCGYVRSQRNCQVSSKKTDTMKLSFVGAGSPHRS